MSLTSDLFRRRAPVTLEDLQAYFDALDREKLRVNMLFDSKVRIREGEHAYFKPDGAFRDVGSLLHELTLDASVLSFVIARGKNKGREVGVILTPEFLTREQLRRHGLAVDVLSAYLPLLVRYMETHKALAFAETSGMSDGKGGMYPGAHLLFRNPRGKWQLSHFSAGLGPTGHQEGDTPAEALHQWVSLTTARPDDGSHLEQVMRSPDVLDGVSGAHLRGLAKLVPGKPVSDEALGYAMRKLSRQVKRCGITREALRAGMTVELEHRDVTRGAIEKTARIAVAHLCESPRYYVELAKLERRLSRDGAKAHGRTRKAST